MEAGKLRGRGRGRMNCNGGVTRQHSGRKFVARFLAKRPPRGNGAVIFTELHSVFHFAGIRLAHREGEGTCTFGQNRDGD